MLLPRQKVAGRLYLAARVFRIKFQALMAFMIGFEMSRHVKPYVWVIVLQKRRHFLSETLSARRVLSNV